MPVIKYLVTLIVLYLGFNKENDDWLANNFLGNGVEIRNRALLPTKKWKCFWKLR